MDEKIQKRLNKLFENRDSTEKDLYKCHALVLKHIENQSCSTKIETFIKKCKTLMKQAIEKNEEIIQLAGKAEHTDKYIPKQDLWLHKLTKTSSKTLQEAEIYKFCLEKSEVNETEEKTQK